LTESSRRDYKINEFNLSQISPKKSEKSLIDLGEYNEHERERIQKLLEEKEHLTNTQRIRDVLKNDNYKSEQTKDENMGDLGDEDNDNDSAKISLVDSGKKSLELIGEVVTVEDEKQQKKINDYNELK
jgi:hypothetical protein